MYRMVAFGMVLIMACPLLTVAQTADTVEANIFLSEGRNAKTASNFEAAIKSFEAAASIFLSAKDWEKHIDCLDLLSDTYRQMGSYDKALEVGLSGLSLVRTKLEEESLREAELLGTLGIIYDYKGEFNQARDYQLQSIRIKEKHLGSGHVDLVGPYNNLGIVYYYLGDYEKAMECYQQVVSLIENDEEQSSLLSFTYNNIGMIQVLNGDYISALEYLQRALTMRKDALGEGHLELASIYTTIGVAYYYQQNYDKALEYQNKVLQLKRAYLNDDHPQMVISYNNLGLIFGHTGRFEEALTYFNNSLDIQHKNLGPVHSDISLTHRFIGEVHAKAGNVDMALESYRKALNLRLQIFGKKHLDVAESYNDVAEMLLKKGESKQALQNLQLALAANVPAFNDTLGISNPILENVLKENTLLNTLHLKSHALIELYEKYEDEKSLGAALSTLSLCDNLVDRIIQQRLQQEDKVAFASISTQVYEEAVKACVLKYELEDSDEYIKLAFYYMEKSKASVLRQTLSDQAAKSFGVVPDSLLRLEKELKRERDYYQSKIKNNVSDSGSEHPQYNYWEKELFRIGRQLNSLVLSFEINYPQYHDLKYRNDILDVAKVPAMLSGNEGIVEYFLGAQTLYAVVISSKGYRLAKVDFLDSDKLVQKLRKQISSARSMEDIDEFVLNADQLYQIVFDTIENLMPSDVDRLILIPAGPLSFIPFELLLEEIPEKIDFRSLPYLLKKYKIGYAYSVSLWARNNVHEKEWLYPFAGYAPIYDDQIYVQDSLLREGDQLYGRLSKLEYSREEVDGVAKYSDGAVFIGDAALESAFKKDAYKYRVLHMAMHAVVDEENPMHSKLIFAPPKDSLEDGLLNIYELYNLELNADLAVLSACNTGIGKLQKGEGVMSLGRAFSYAGCPSIVMSLWPAQDRATADIMNNFYQGLFNGLTKDDALQKAKLDYLENASDLVMHPFYWAGFVVQGDTAPLELQSRLFFWLGLGFASFLLAAIALFIYRKK